MTLEATIVFPVFLAFMLLLINFMKIGVVYLAVSHAVSETTKQIATHAYPLVLAKQGAAGVIARTGVSDLALMENDFTKKLLDSVGENMSQEMLDNVLYEISSPMIEDYIPGGIIDKGQIDIEVKMCNPWAGRENTHNIGDIELSSEDVAIVANYKVKLLFPFVMEREVRLTNISVERAWLR
ncbi:MAG: hypothetical protein ACOY46_20160 [Bacillota bacterium]